MVINNGYMVINCSAYVLCVQAKRGIIYTDYFAHLVCVDDGPTGIRYPLQWVQKRAGRLSALRRPYINRQENQGSIHECI